MKGTKITTKEIYGYVDPNIVINQIKENIHKMNEVDFITNIRMIKTYEERKNLLINRDYKLLNEEIKDKNFYYCVQNVNLLGKVELWYKRKPFNLIKKELLSKPNIVSEKPYSEFTVFDDNGKPHIFYKKN